MKFNSLILKSTKYLLHQIKFVSYKAFRKNKSKPVIFFHLYKPHIFNRYLYSLIKFLHVEGFQIWFPNNFEIFRSIYTADIYLKLLIKEKIIHFENPVKSEVFLEFNKHNLSADYYSGLFNRKENELFFPIAQHPIFYSSKLWDNTVGINTRKRSVFMSGNFDEIAYSTIENSYFDVNSRIEIFEYLDKKNQLTEYSSSLFLQEFLRGAADHQCIIIRKKDFSIPVKQLRKTLASFHFYLACPGVVIPHSHNVIEAMSVGCIPLIQEKYAQLFMPSLIDGENAILFKDLSDLSRKIDSCYHIKSDVLDKMHNNVYSYYKNHLTPSAVVKKIKDKKYKKFYLQAEFESAKLFRYSNLLEKLEKK